jgi:hypothetical protein
MQPTTTFPAVPTTLKASISFLVLSPLMTYGLLIGKGLPSFAVDHLWTVLVWVYQVTWIPALLSGLSLSLVLTGIRSRVLFFIRPYDFGRCLSLGVVLGALTEAASTWGYRLISHRPFSSFWIAGAMISGALAAAIIVPVLLLRLSKMKGAA